MGTLRVAGRSSPQATRLRDLLEATPTGVSVGELADVAAPAVSPQEPLDRAFDLLSASGHRAIAVVAAGTVEGLLRLEDVGRALSRRDAGSSRASGRVP